MRDCIDRNYLAGEWRSVDERTPNGANGRGAFDVSRKREEYFADFVMRGALATRTPALALTDLRFLCPVPGMSLDDYLHDPHGEPLFRLATLTQATPLRQEGQSQEPPLACEQALSAR
jgi:hypothetical protein